MNRNLFQKLTIACFILLNAFALASAQEKPSTQDSSIIKEFAVILAIPSDDEFYLGKEKTPRDQIVQTVKTLLKDKPPDEQIVYIKIAGTVKYGTIVSIITLLEDSGINRIGLVTDKKKGTPPGSATKRKVEARGKERRVHLLELEDQLIVKVVAEARKKKPAPKAKPLSLTALASRLQELLVQRQDKTVIIMAGESELYGGIVRFIDEVKKAGAEIVRLQIDSQP